MMRTSFLFTGLLLVLFASSMSYSQNSIANKKKLAPMQVEGTTKVDAEKVIELAERIPNLMVIDARIKMDRLQGYIEGSHSLPDVDTNCETLAKLIPVKTSPVLFYCNGVKCGRSVKSSKKAVKCGYQKIFWFRGGFEEWKNKGLPFVKE